MEQVPYVCGVLAGFNPQPLLPLVTRFPKVHSVHDTTSMPKPHKILSRRWLTTPRASILCLCHVAGHVSLVPCGVVAVHVPRLDLMKSGTMYVLTPVPYIQRHLAMSPQN